MNNKRPNTLRPAKLFRFWAVIAVIFGVFIFTLVPLAKSIRQGLDLQGGTHIVMQAEDTPENKVTPEAVTQVIAIMQKRINEMGLTEPIIQREGANRIIIELPGEKDPKKAIETIGKTAVLQFKDEDGNVALTGEDLKTAQEQMDSNSRNPVVALQFTDEGVRSSQNLPPTTLDARLASTWMASCLLILWLMKKLMGEVRLLPDRDHWKKQRIWLFCFAVVLSLSKYPLWKSVP